MLVWKRILELRKRIAAQLAYMEKCGGDLAGYIATYGDPGVPPLNKDGSPKTLIVPPWRQDEVSELITTGKYCEFYRPHSGDGGTAIYRADRDRLEGMQRELSALEVSCPSARIRADEKGFSSCQPKETP